MPTTLELISPVQMALSSWDSPLELSKCIQTHHSHLDPTIFLLKLSSLPLFSILVICTTIYPVAHTRIFPPPSVSGAGSILDLVAAPSFPPSHSLSHPTASLSLVWIIMAASGLVFLPLIWSPLQAHLHKAAKVLFLKCKLNVITLLLHKAFRRKLKFLSSEQDPYRISLCPLSLPLSIFYH